MTSRHRSNSSISTILAVGGMVIALAVPSLAQEEAGGLSVDEQAQLFADEIRAQAAAFYDNMAALQGALDNLPEDPDTAAVMAIQLYDESIANLQIILAEVGPDSGINRGIGDLQSTAEEYRDEWLQRCEETGDSRVCTRVEI